MPIQTTGLKAGAAALAGLSLTACVNLSPDIVYPLGKNTALEGSRLADTTKPASEGILTAKSGDILLSQAVQNTVIYVLENEVVSEGNISLSVQKRELDLDPGSSFYAAVNLGQEPALVACSLGRPATVIPRLNPGAQGSGKICFELETLAEGLDVPLLNLEQEVFETDKFFFVADGVYAITGEASPYQKLARWDPQFIYKVTPPAKLRRADPEAASGRDIPELGLRYIFADGAAQLEPIYVTEGRPVATEAKPIEIDVSKDFPMTIEEDGAQIELLTITEGVLAYRVLSGFQTAKSFVMDLPE